MQITLVRHIQTIAPKGMCYGQTDVALPPGYDNVHKELASQLNSHLFDAIWSSPLQRCALLAKAIAGKNHSLNFDNRLKEVNFGLWEQKMWREIEKTDEASYFFADYLNRPSPEGESLPQLWQRIESFVADLKTKNEKQNVLIVSHSGPIRIFHALSKHLKPEDIFNLNPQYGEISHIQI